MAIQFSLLSLRAAIGGVAIQKGSATLIIYWIASAFASQ